VPSTTDPKPPFPRYCKSAADIDSNPLACSFLLPGLLTQMALPLRKPGDDGEGDMQVGRGEEADKRYLIGHTKRFNKG
jgi:hypothetical protein